MIDNESLRNPSGRRGASTVPRVTQTNTEDLIACREGRIRLFQTVKDPVQKFGAQYGIRNQEPAETNGGHLQAASPGKIPGRGLAFLRNIRLRLASPLGFAAVECSGLLRRFFMQGCKDLLDYLFDGTAGINDEGVLRSLQGCELALEQSFGKKMIFPFSQSFRQRKLINVKEDKVDSRQAFLHNLPVRFLQG